MAHLYAVSRNTAVRRTLPRLTVCRRSVVPVRSARRDWRVCARPRPRHAAAPGPAVPTPRVLQTDDNWGIYITFFPAPGDREVFTKEAPVVILLHGDKQNRLVYEGPRGLATRLQQEGCAVITVDLRKHGQSTNVAQVGGDGARALAPPKRAFRPPIIATWSSSTWKS